MLIELVKTKEELYNLQSPLNSDNNYKKKFGMKSEKHWINMVSKVIFYYIKFSRVATVQNLLAN